MAKKTRFTVYCLLVSPKPSAVQEQKRLGHPALAPKVVKPSLDHKQAMRALKSAESGKSSRWPWTYRIVRAEGSY
jgi:hypothetical protein